LRLDILRRRELEGWLACATWEEKRKEQKIGSNFVGWEGNGFGEVCLVWAE